MLETEIKNLAAEIKMLREALTSTTLPTPIPVDNTEVETAPVDNSPSGVTHTVADLQALCAKVVRLDKTKNRKAVVTMLAKYDATLIEQVPESNYNELFDKLTALGG
jgi:hypothetical protein